jgi:hypothetical protein
VTREVGSLSEAWRMPTEVRRWWLDQMRKEIEEQQEEFERASGRRTVSAK